MSKSKLKKSIKDLDADQLRDLVIEIYEAVPTAKRWLDFYSDPNVDKALENAKTKITRAIYSTTGTVRRNPSFSKLKEVVGEFILMCPEPMVVADVLTAALLTVVRAYGERPRVMSARITSCRLLFEYALKQLDRYGVLEQRGKELQSVIDKASASSRELGIIFRNSYENYLDLPHQD